MTSSSSSTTPSQKSRLLLACLPPDVISNIIHPMLGTSLSHQLQLLCDDVSRDLVFTHKVAKTNGWKLRSIKECLEKGYPSPHGKRKFGLGEKRLPYHPLIAPQANERSAAILAFAIIDKVIASPAWFVDITESGRLEKHYAVFTQFVKNNRDIELQTWLGQDAISILAYTQWIKATKSPVRGKKMPDGSVDKRLFSYMNGRRVYCDIFYRKYSQPILFTVFEQMYTHANTIFDDIIQKTDTAKAEEEKKEA